jgi:hypothetical protein
MAIGIPLCASVQVIEPVAQEIHPVVFHAIQEIGLYDRQRFMGVRPEQPGV